VVISRNETKCRATVDRIRAETGNPNVDFLVADLSSQAATRAVAAAFQEKYDRLDVLVNNAGVFYTSRQESADGIEMTFALNHLGYFLLTELLRDMLVESAPSRVVSVSSGAHFGGKINFDDLEGKQKYSGWQAYSNSKLANVLFTAELARQLDGTGVTANSLHPGFVASNFAMNNLTGFMSVIRPFYRLLQKVVAISPEKGAETMIFLATSPEVEGVTGKYFDKSKAVTPSKAAQDMDAAKRLWAMSEGMVGV
jgi:NAD(P)-dependent dehydrogenase (short-subunit alcohol dehydrogenase family)